MHEPFLQAALKQAWLGRGSCAPNPSVGAVAVQNGAIIAEDYHRGAGTPHAERLVFEHMPEQLQGITLYVTLEPCNHWGRTPPCVDAIINYGVECVVFGYADPNPLVSSNGTTALLNAQGIDVIHYPLPEIDQFYQSYQYWTQTNKPWVSAKIAQSLDGKIAGPEGHRVQLTNAACRNWTHQCRQHADVILTTARTICMDDPLLTVRLSDTPVGKPLAILDRQNQLNPDANIFKHSPLCHIFYDENLPKPLEKAGCQYHPVPCVQEQLSLDAVISQLGALGYHDVYVEAGGQLFTALHQEKLVNQTYVYISPKILGDEAIPAYHAPALFDGACKNFWQPMDDNMILSLLWNS